MDDSVLTSAKMTEDIKEFTAKWSNEFITWSGDIIGCLISAETIPDTLVHKSREVQALLQNFQIMCAFRDAKKLNEVNNG